MNVIFDHSNVKDTTSFLLACGIFVSFMPFLVFEKARKSERAAGTVRHRSLLFKKFKIQGTCGNLTSSHGGFLLSTFVLGSKLPLFPYNRG